MNFAKFLDFTYNFVNFFKNQIFWKRYDKNRPNVKHNNFYSSCDD